jgi:KTSC domain
MNVTAVQSSTLAMVAYDRTRELLELEFNSHAIYQYQGVPASVHEALLRAASKGSYFNQAIRGKFPYTRICKTTAGAPRQDLAAERRR